NPRRKARETALQILYKFDVSIDGTLAGDYSKEMDTLTPGTEAHRYCESIVAGVMARVAELDRIIEESSDRWKIERMPVVDRNVLRLAAYELVFCPETPFKVVIDEAVELAKRFGAEDSGAFINGILDRVRKEEPSRAATQHVNEK
ncbi:MAG: transcription antitermination factor NusB, partial [Deltaproteobacteria bacterium]|nr:transcription antitermination factor NusB [Deltaproteobacteria bacterium]